MAGPDVGGSMGGHDPEKYGPIRTLVAHYAKMPHPFRTCVRDNTKRFGPERVKRICAWIKDQARGTTKWRNTSGLKKGSRLTEAAFRESLIEEGFTEHAIEVEIFEAGGAPDEPSFQELRDYCKMACDSLGVKYKDDGYDEACPNCGAWSPCDCKVAHGKSLVMQESETREHYRKLLEATRPSAEGDVERASRTPGLSDDIKASKKLQRQARAAEGASGGGSSDNKDDAKEMVGVDDRHPREVARAESGQIVYDDGSVKDESTGITKYPAQVFQDGSVRYDDGTVAHPGSLAALMVMMPMTKEDRAKLAVAGPKGLPISEFASVTELINSAVNQLFDDTGVGGMGELRSDAAAMQQGVPSNELPTGRPETRGIADGLTPQDYAGIVGDATAGDLARRRDAAAGRGKDVSVANADRYKPIKLKRGEKVVRGPQGGRGVWRQVDGNPIFIKVGQSVAQASAEQRAAGKRR